MTTSTGTPTGNWCDTASAISDYADRLEDAIDHARTSGMDRFELDMGSWLVCYPGRADYFTHWGAAFKHCAAVLGLPIGSYPHSRPPQALLPDAAKAQIEAAYQRLGLAAGEDTSAAPPKW